MKTRYYTGNGLVAGLMWGGGVGAYEARHYSSETLEDLREQIQKDFQSGALDSGAGFERLVAAQIVVIEELTLEIEGRDFVSQQLIEPVQLGEKKYLEWLDNLEY